MGGKRALAAPEQLNGKKRRGKKKSLSLRFSLSLSVSSPPFLLPFNDQKNLSNVEALPASAAPLGVRVLEGEAAADQRVAVVELEAEQEEQALRVAHDLYRFVTLCSFRATTGAGLEDVVVRFRLLGEVHRVAHPVAPAAAHADPQK